MSKMNYFACDRKLAERLTSYINDKKVEIGSIRIYYDAQIQWLKSSITNQENLRGSIISDSEINETIAKMQAQIDEVKVKREERLESANKFEWDENDKALEKLSKKRDVTELELACGITAWFRFYGYAITDMDYVYNLVHTCFGIREKSDKAFVMDILKGKDADATQRRTDSIRAFYARISTDAILAGTVKVNAICEEVRETYEKLVAEKKNKKSGKKSSKKSEKTESVPVVSEAPVSETSVETPVEIVDYSTLSYREIQKLCKDKNLSAKGSREELVARLVA